MARVELRGRVSLDGSGFERTLARMRQQATVFATSVGGLLAGAFGTAAMVRASKAVLGFADRIKDLSEQSTATYAEVQKLDLALKASGLNFEDLAGALRGVAKAREEAATGNTELLQTFQKFNITYPQLINSEMRHLDILQQVMRAAGEMNLTQRERNDLTKIFGEKSSKMIQALSELQKFDGVKIMGDNEIEKFDAVLKKIQELKREMIVFAGSNAMAMGGLHPSDFFNERGQRLFGIQEPEARAEPMSAAQVAEANAKKWFQFYWKEIAGKEPLYDLKPIQDDEPFGYKPMEPRRGRGVGGLEMLNELQRHGAFAGMAGKSREQMELERNGKTLEKIERNTARGASTWAQ